MKSSYEFILPALTLLLSHTQSKQPSRPYGLTGIPGMLWAFLAPSEYFLFLKESLFLKGASVFCSMIYVIWKIRKENCFVLALYMWSHLVLIWLCEISITTTLLFFLKTRELKLREVKLTKITQLAGVIPMCEADVSVMGTECPSSTSSFTPLEGINQDRPYVFTSLILLTFSFSQFLPSKLFCFETWFYLEIKVKLLNHNL